MGIHLTLIKMLLAPRRYQMLLPMQRNRSQGEDEILFHVVGTCLSTFFRNHVSNNVVSALSLPVFVFILYAFVVPNACHNHI
jgi:hypothetical protein